VHPSDATLLSLIHGELSPTPSAEVQEHVTSCEPCGVRLQELRAGDAEIGRLLATLDHPIPRRLPPTAIRGSRPKRAALAAALALLAAGAAAAAVPGTPVHRWVQEHLAPPVRPDTPPTTTPPAQSPATEQAASGIEIAAPAALTISFGQPEAGATLTVARSDRNDVSLRAFGGAVAYQVGAGKIVVDNQRPAGRYQLEVPNGLARLTVVLGGRVIFTSSGGQVSRSGPDTISLSTDGAR